MTISGKTVREHIELLTPLFGAIAAVWVLRMIVGGLGAPAWLTKILSVSVIVPTSILLMVLLVHVKRFGSYANVVFGTVLLAAWGEMLIVGAILFAVFTGTENIYTVPEFSIPGDDLYHSRHVLGHLTFGIGFETLSGSLMGCILLYMLRRTGRKPPPGVRAED